MAWSCEAQPLMSPFALNRASSSSSSSSSSFRSSVSDLSPIYPSSARFRRHQPSCKPQRAAAAADLPSTCPGYYISAAAAAALRRRIIVGTQICRAAGEYQFPDPIPEFAEAETEKFRAHLLKKLSKKDIYGDQLQEVVRICTEIFSTFLHTEYGGPGTLLVIPFIDMADTLDERGLSGRQAARAAVKWARKHVDKDWKEWTSKSEGE